MAPKGGEFLLPVSAEQRKSAGVAAGDEVEVDLELDVEPRTVAVPRCWGRYPRAVSVPASHRAVTFETWLDAAAGVLERVEVVDGELVVRRIGGNPHHYLARRLAEEFERQWPGVIATAPGNWALQLTDAGDVVTGRVPDVLVNGSALLTDPVFAGVPEAAVEVWSPGNTLADMNAKRRDYRAAGLPVLVEAFLTDAGDVHLEWLVQQDGRWVTSAVAVGETTLEVSEPRPFAVVPNALLRPRA